MNPTNVENRLAPVIGTGERVRRNHYVAKHHRAAWVGKFPDATTISDWLYREGEFVGHWETAYGQPIDDSQIGSDGIPNDSDAKWVDHPMTNRMMDIPVVKSLFDNIEQYGGLTDNQTFLARQLMTKMSSDATKLSVSASQWVGKIKERRKWSLTIDKIMAYEGNYGMSYLNMMHDDEDNIVIGKGTKRFGTEGTTITVVATIVGHTTRDGNKQTIINRPKFV